MIILLSSLKKHSGFMRYFKNTSWMLVEQIFRIVSGFFIGIWVARYLEPTQFGQLSYILAFTGIFAGIAKLGLDNIVIKELVNNPSSRESYLGTAFWLKAFGAIVVLCAIITTITFTQEDTQTSLLILILASGMLFQSFEVIEFYFQSQVLAKVISICKVLQISISSCIKLYLLLSKASLIWFVFALVIDNITLAIAYFFSYKYQKKKMFYFCFDIKIAKKLLRQSWPLVIGSLGLMIHSRIDVIMLKQLIGDIEVGYYSVSLRLIEFLGFIPIVLATSIFPAILNAKKSNSLEYKLRLQNYYRLMFILFLTVAIPIFFLSNVIINTLYGPLFLASGNILAWMSFRLFFTNFGVARGLFINSEGLYKYDLYSTISGILVNVGLNYIFIPIYGARAAVATTMVSFFVSTFLIDLCYAKTRRNTLSQIYSMLSFYKIKVI